MPKIADALDLSLFSGYFRDSFDNAEDMLLFAKGKNVVIENIRKSTFYLGNFEAGLRSSVEIRVSLSYY